MKKTHPTWTPKGYSTYLGEFAGYALWATEEQDGRVEFTAVSDGGLASSSERPPSPPRSEADELRLHAELDTQYPDLGPYEPSPVEECKRRWWATQPTARLLHAQALADAQRAEAGLWRKRHAGPRGEA